MNQFDFIALIEFESQMSMHLLARRRFPIRFALKSQFYHYLLIT